MPIVPSLDRERRAWAGGGLLVGVDEAGRGPLAGPVVAAAVVFPAGVAPIEGVRDSKTLPEEQRTEAARAIRASALKIGVGAASCREIDRFNIRQATVLAMRRAICRALQLPTRGRGRWVVGRGIPLGPSSAFQIIIDGLALPELGLDHEALVDGDAFCFSIAAAGIIAKTVRDRLMFALGGRYPGYGWETNRGYATDFHLQAINSHGPTPHHRQTFAPVAQYELLL